MGRSVRTYQAVEGSARLRTAALAAAPALARAEALAAGEMRRIPFEGELVGAARPRGRCAAIPLDAFDAAGARLEPEEQGAYFQLLRLSYAEGRNFCRVAKRDLLSRLGTSEKRLHRILDGLVRKGFVRLLHRDNRGTAFRVYLPREAAGEGDDDVVLGLVVAPADAVELPAPRPAPAQRHVPAAAPADARAPSRAIPLGDARTRALAASLAAARGDPESGLAAAMRDVSDLVADGATPRQVEAAIRAVARRRTEQEVAP